MDNMTIYNAARQCPAEALKKIQAGRLAGKSDINPMWRIKKLTELFGVCGFGWKYTIDKQWTEMFGNEVKAFVNISLYIKMNGEWSDAIPGNGGSTFVEQGRNGAYVNDECYKMALTDAISVACKALGMAADIYWSNDNTKYNDSKNTVLQQTQQAPQQSPTIQKAVVAVENAGLKVTAVEQPKVADPDLVAAILKKIAECQTKAELQFVRQYAGTPEYNEIRVAANNRLQALKK